MNKFYLLFATAGLAMLAACQPKNQAAAPAPAAPNVTVAKPVVKDIVEWNEFTGRLDSNQNVDIRARVSGYLEAIHFTEGQQVKKGDLLFTIDPRPFQAEVNSAEATLSQAKAAASLADSNLVRAKTLIAGNAISKEEFDLRQSEAEQAAANVEAAKARLETTQLNLGYTEIRSPIDGIAGEHLAAQGNLINGDTANATLLTTVVPDNPIYVYFDMDEASRLAYLRNLPKVDFIGRPGEGLAVEMQLSDEQGFPHKGVIDFIDNRLDRSTATIRVRGRFDNANHFLSPGLFARVRVPSGGEYQAIMIPDSSIGTNQSEKFVWVIGADNHARQQAIEPGPLHDGLRVIRSGLTADDRIVVRGIQLVRAGSPLSISEENLSPTAPEKAKGQVAQN